MFDKEFETIVLAPVNFAEIVAKTQRCKKPISAAECEAAFAKAQAADDQYCVFIVEFDPEE